jgi:hypothetical protein
LNYFFLTLKHKYFVFIAGLKFKVPILRLILHDMSKLTLNEYSHYQKQFFGKKDDPEGFMCAWLHHQNVNEHHWEYWIPRSGHNLGNDPSNFKPIPMSENALREMVADWFGASKAYNGKWPKPNEWEWLKENRNKIVIHEQTRKLLDEILKEKGF